MNLCSTFIKCVCLILNRILLYYTSYTKCANKMLKLLLEIILTYGAIIALAGPCIKSAVLSQFSSCFPSSFAEMETKYFNDISIRTLYLNIGRNLANKIISTSNYLQHKRTM